MFKRTNLQIIGDVYEISVDGGPQSISHWLKSFAKLYEQAPMRFPMFTRAIQDIEGLREINEIYTKFSFESGKCHFQTLENGFVTATLTQDNHFILSSEKPTVTLDGPEFDRLILILFYQDQESKQLSTRTAKEN